METFKHIDIAGTKALQEQGATLLDIRDPGSYASGHIEGATHLTNENIQQIIAETDKSSSVVVYCYHGVSSQQAAQYLVTQGFSDVYSMDGGFEVWRQSESVSQ